MAIDIIIKDLKSKFTGLNINFIINLILFTNDNIEAQRMMNHVSYCLPYKGMRLNPKNCLSVTVPRVPHKKKLVVLTNAKYEDQ